MPKVQSDLMSRFKQRPKQGRVPLWDGPESNTPQGGITQSMLSSFLVCRERFRIKVIEGLKPIETWNQRLGYGEMWHICEEAFAAHGDGAEFYESLDRHTRKQMTLFPMQQEMIWHWHRVCLTQFPIYIRYWSKNKDVVNRTPLLQEESFSVPYKLPSGRTVYIRGKWDSVDTVKRGRKMAMVLQENKTKGDIDEQQLHQQLTFDLQTMIYMIALGEWIENELNEGEAMPAAPLVGVRYNVVRRPLSGGVGSIKKSEGTKGAKCTLKSCKVDPSPYCEKCGGTGRVGAKPAETDDEFYARLGTIIQEDANESLRTGQSSRFFMRWNVDITAHDIEKFKREFLNPCLEHLCDWYDHVRRAFVEGLDPFGWGHRPGIHHRCPFGIYNPLAEGKSTDLDSYLAGGDGVGLVKAETLFSELE